MNKNALIKLSFLLLPPLLWAGNFVVGRALHTSVAPFTLSFLRWLIAFFVLLPFALPYVRRDWALYRLHFRSLLGISLAGVLAFTALVYWGLHSTTTTNALLLNSCIPVLIMLFAALIYRQKLPLWQWCGLAISLGGVLTIILRGSWQTLLTLSFHRGDILVFSAMISWAFYTLWMRKIPPEIHRFGLLLMQIICAMPLLFLLFISEALQGGNLHLNASTAAGIAYVALAPSIVAYLLYQFAVQEFGAVRAGLSIHLIPFFGVLLAWAFLDEQLQLYHAIGMAAIIGGLWLTNKKTA